MSAGLTVIFYVLLVLIAVWAVWVLAQCVRFDNTTGALLKNGLVLLIFHIPASLGILGILAAGLISAVLMLIFEEPRLDAILSAWLPILYAGVMSCGVAYTLQFIGQKDMDPTIASLILSLESVISVLAGWAILHQKLSIRELFGCLVMFGAIILAQLPERKEKER